MSAGVSVNDLGGERARDVGTLPATSRDKVSIFDGIEVIDDPVVENVANGEPAPTVASPVVADDVLDGFRDPIMPFVILGIVSLITIVAVAALLVL